MGQEEALALHKRQSGTNGFCYTDLFCKNYGRVLLRRKELGRKFLWSEREKERPHPFLDQCPQIPKSLGWAEKEESDYLNQALLSHSLYVRNELHLEMEARSPTQTLITG